MATTEPQTPEDLILAEIAIFEEKYSLEPMRNATDNASTSSSKGFGGFLKKAAQAVGMSSKSGVIVFLVGPRAGGKTTITYKLKLGELVTTIPTMSFNPELIQFRNKGFLLIDMSLESEMKTLDVLGNVAQRSEGKEMVIALVVDSNDRENQALAREMNNKIAETPSLEGIPMLFWLNKQDLPNALTLDDLLDTLAIRGQEPITNGRHFHPERTCAVDGAGLYEGLEWILATLPKDRPLGAGKMVKSANKT